MILHQKMICFDLPGKNVALCIGRKRNKIKGENRVIWFQGNFWNECQSRNNARSWNKNVNFESTLKEHGL